MHLLTQTTLIHQVRINISIVRYRVNQNRSNLITKLTFHLDNRCQMINLLIIQCCINPRNTISNIPNCFFILKTVNIWSSTLMLCKISPAMILATSPNCKGLFPSPFFFSSDWNPYPLSATLNLLYGATFSLSSLSYGFPLFLTQFPLFFSSYLSNPT